MKGIFTILFISFSLAVFAQSNIPETSEKGILILKDNTSVSYKNLKYEKGKLTYTNTANGKNEFVYDASVQEIKDGMEEHSSILTNPKKLTSNEEIRRYLEAGNNDVYMKGKKTSSLGTGFLVGGAACFVVGAVLNLSAPAETPSVTNQTTESTGSPVPLIIGLAGMGTGLVMKISGNSKMKEAINSYKSADNSKTKTEYFLVNNLNGIGLKMKF
ncbi:hypothetical protein KSK37_02480 [Kaistella sp. DKR-2]|uniref:hypothetical protein n=1 Tax=Kaistella soli TaxID=2849654 RepID=UPI001C26B59E|nr:hypothetical protein [Kaistella soli]MBU8881943.1 hypothetical protein [Kaistella soli]